MNPLERSRRRRGLPVHAGLGGAVVHATRQWHDCWHALALEGSRYGEWISLRCDETNMENDVANDLCDDLLTDVYANTAYSYDQEKVPVLQGHVEHIVDSICGDNCHGILETAPVRGCHRFMRGDETEILPMYSTRHPLHDDPVPEGATPFAPALPARGDALPRGSSGAAGEGGSRAA